MTSKQQLQTKIQELETQLAEFKNQLNTYKSPTIRDASVGVVLEDGSIVLKKENGLALLVAPASTQVESAWTPEFPEVFSKLKEQGFVPSQWFVPTKKQLQLAYEVLRNEFSSTYYWSSTESSSTCGCFVNFDYGSANSCNKAGTGCVRAFRCVTY